MAQTTCRTNEYLGSMHGTVVNDDRKHDIRVGIGNITMTFNFAPLKVD